MGLGGGLIQAQTQKITDAVQSSMAAVNARLADARNDAIKAALTRNATELVAVDVEPVPQ